MADNNNNLECLIIDDIEYPIKVENGLYLTFVALPINDDMGHVVIAKSKEALIKQVKESHKLHKQYKEWENNHNEGTSESGLV